MRLCIDCGLAQNLCVCKFVDDFLLDNEDLMDDLQEMELSQRRGHKRCIECCRFNCKCPNGKTFNKKEKTSARTK